MIRFCVAALLLAGCSGAEIDLTVTPDPSLLGTYITALTVSTTGADDFSGEAYVRRSLLSEERLVYRTHSTSGALGFTISAHDDSGDSLGCGRATTELHAGTFALAVPLTPGPCYPDTGDGGMPLDGGTDGGMILPSSCTNRAVHPEWLLCDGFDGTMVDSNWLPDTLAGTATIDPVTLFRGSGAVRFHLDTATSDMGSDYEVARIAQGMPSVASLFVRVFVKLPGATVNHTVNNSTLLKLIRSTSDNSGLFLSWNPGSQLSVYSVGASGSVNNSGGVLSASGWTCLEWQVPTTSGNIHVWIDGNEVAALAGSASFGFQLGTLVLGTDTNVFTGNAVDFWMDDLIVSTTRVGCAP